MQGLEAVKETKSDLPGASAERTKSGGREPAADTSLGHFLVAAREQRGLSREQAVKQTRIPEHYLKMLESNDCSMISDQLYLLPFLRRYSTFLQIDPEETAMRFVREVQRADNNPSTARIDTPLGPRRRKRRNWNGIAIVTLLLAVIVVAYLAESRHRESADNAAPASALSAVAAAPGATAGTAKPETTAPPSSSGVATGASQNPATNALGQKSAP